MVLYFRLIRVMLAALLGRPLRPLGESVLSFRVWPTDLDVNWHVNNSKYLALMDLGRLDLLLRTGLGRATAGRGWQVILASVMIRFRRGLRPGERFALHTRVLGWDEKWIYLEQTFRAGGTVAAVAQVRGLFRSKAGNVPTREMLGAIGIRGRGPRLSRSVTGWVAAEDRMLRERGLPLSMSRPVKRS